MKTTTQSSPNIEELSAMLRKKFGRYFHSDEQEGNRIKITKLLNKAT